MKSVLTNFLRRKEKRAFSWNMHCPPSKNQYFCIRATISIYCYLDGLSIHGAWSILKTLLEVMLEILGSEMSNWSWNSKNYRIIKFWVFVLLGITNNLWTPIRFFRVDFVVQCQNINLTKAWILVKKVWS